LHDENNEEDLTSQTSKQMLRDYQRPSIFRFGSKEKEQEVAEQEQEKEKEEPPKKAVKKNRKKKKE